MVIGGWVILVGYISLSGWISPSESVIPNRRSSGRDVHTCRYYRRPSRYGDPIQLTLVSFQIAYRFSIFLSYFSAASVLSFPPTGFPFSYFTMLSHIPVLSFYHSFQFFGPTRFTAFTNFTVLPIFPFYQFNQFSAHTSPIAQPALPHFRPYQRSHFYKFFSRAVSLAVSADI